MTTTTPNMNLELPTPDETTGPQWAELLNTALTTIDSHTHATGDGVKITPAGMNINADLTIAANNLTNIRSTRFSDQSTQFSAVSDVGVLYVLNGEIIYRDIAGNNVQITDNGGLNLASIGTIGGDYGQPGVDAAVVYSDITKTFIFTREAGVGAIISGSNLELTYPLAGEDTITIGAPSGATAYSLTLPSTLPSANGSMFSVNTDGTTEFTDDVSLTSITLNTGTFASGMNLWYDSSNRLRINGGTGGVLFADSTNATTLATLSDAGIFNLSSNLTFGPNTQTASGIGLYRAASDALGFSTAGANRGNISTAGSWSIGEASVNTTHNIYGNKTTQTSATATSSLALVNTGGGSGFDLSLVSSEANITNNAGGGINFYISATERGELSSTGNWTLGSGGFSGTHQINGNLAVSTQISSALGSVSAPGYAFTGDLNTGIYSAGVDTLNFATGGAASGSIASTTAWTLGASGTSVTHTLNGASAKVLSGSTSADLTLRNSTTGDALGLALTQNGVNTTLSNNSNGSLTFATNATTAGSIASTGAWTLGPASTTLTHTINVGASSRAIKFGPGSGNIRPGLTVDNAGSSVAVAMATGAGNPQLNFAGGTLLINNGTYATVSDAADMGTGGAGTTVGQVSTAGAWTLGTASTQLTHTINGAIFFGYENSTFPTNGHIWRDTSDQMRFNATGGYVFSNDGNSTNYGTIGTGGWNIGGAPASINTNDTTCYGLLRVEGNNPAGSNGQLRIYRSTSTTTHTLFNGLSDVGGSSVVVWRVECDGDTISTTGSYTSDERAKKDIEPIHYGLSQILQLNPISFRWNHEDASESKSFSVATAQEVQAIMPEMVRDDGLDCVDSEGEVFQAKSLYAGEVVAVMVKAIQELKAMVDQQQQEINILKGL